MRNTLLETSHGGQLEIKVPEVQAAQIPYFVRIVWKIFVSNFPSDLPCTL